MKVLIAGGGIGGLVTALNLHRLGIEVHVFESVPEIKALGVGINLLPHAVRELTRLDLDSKLAEQSIPTAELIYYNKFGQLIWREPRGREAGYHWPQYSIHRGRLQMILLEAVQEELGKEVIRTGHHLHSFEDKGDHVTATFIDRESGKTLVTESGDLLIGADGIHSQVRKSFYPNEVDPKFSGYILWRGMSEAEPFLTGRSMVMIGHARQKFVAYPICPYTAIKGRSLINWIAELYVGGDAPMKRDWNRRGNKESFLPPFKEWLFDWINVPSIIENAIDIFEFPMIDRDPVDRWSFNRVTLIGDAAHPMYPIGSNGASQAILDSTELANALAAHNDVPEALVAYEQKRLGPTAKVVLMNRQMGPERVMQMVEERAPDGFTNLYDVISREELEEVSRNYKLAAGFDKETLNSRV
jgi:5-methylphenazine-1-carboxylate 1-monooxygenase